jgi:hypothetical protein
VRGGQFLVNIVGLSLFLPSFRPYETSWLHWGANAHPSGADAHPSRQDGERAAMIRHVAAMLIGLPAGFLLSGCATRTTVAGGEIGGAVPMTGITRVEASDLARAHCAKYGRSSRILAIRSEDGEKAVFECVKPK